MSAKVAVVTGGGRGLGRGISLRLARDGFRVAVVYHSRGEEAEAVVRELSDGGGEGFALQADVSQRGDVLAFVARVLDAYGRIDVLVNNAGIAYLASTIDLDEDEWDRVIDVNLKGAFLCSQAVIPAMREQGGGRIIHMSSVAAQIGGAIGPHYAASKAGLVGLMRHQARELGRDNITVNAVAPANIPTDMLTSLGLSPNPPRPIQRQGTLEDVAAAVSFLASDDAGFITGQMLSVNGGSYFG